VTAYDAVLDQLRGMYSSPAGLDFPAAIASDARRPLPTLKPSNSVTPIDDCEERLVPLLDVVELFDPYREFGLSHESMEVRSGVADRLVVADGALPDGCHLVVVEGWRSRARQEVLHNLAAEAAGPDAASFAADPTAPGGLVPPHSTGGAVDVTLSVNGVRLGLGGPVGAYDESAGLCHLEQLGPSVERDLRRMLYWSLVGAGFVGIPEEWWHFSFGDQEWAAQTGATAAIYGQVGW
jgi:D-alanyl-D-alanine dipeptidase